VSASANATLEDALDTGPVAAWNGTRLPQRPALEATGRLEWKGPRLRLAADVHHLGDNYLDRFNRYRESNRTLLGVAMSVAPFSAPLRFTLEGKNLADRHTADVGGFPLPGRSLWAALEWHLAPNAAPSEASRP
jgi:hypothetical protein